MITQNSNGSLGFTEFELSWGADLIGCAFPCPLQSLRDKSWKARDEMAQKEKEMQAKLKEAYQKAEVCTHMVYVKKNFPYRSA